MPVLRAVTAPTSTDPYTWIQGCDYKRIETLYELLDYVRPNYTEKKPLFVDFESNSLDVWTPAPDLAIVGVNISIRPGSARYIPVGHRVGFEKNLSLAMVLKLLYMFEQAGIDLIFFGGKYDHELLYHCARNIPEVPDRWVPTKFQEVLFAVWLYDCNQHSFSLKKSAERILGLTMPSYKGVTEGRNFADVDPDEATIYGCCDADCTGRLWLHPGVQAAVARQREVYILECAVLPAFRRMLRNGQYWDDAALEAMELDLGAEVKKKGKKRAARAATGRIGKLTDDILTMIGQPLNFDAPAQVGQALLSLGLNITERTEGPNPQVATGKEILAKYACKHKPECDLKTYKGDACTCGHVCPVIPVQGAPPIWYCDCGHAAHEHQDGMTAPPGYGMTAPGSDNPCRRCSCINPQFTYARLPEIRSCHPVVQKLIMRRELTASARNYIAKLREAIARYGPLLHFPFNQLGAPTGRMSAGGDKTATDSGTVPMNEQSSPDAKKQPYLPDIRAALVANDPRACVAADDPDGFDVVAVDFSQIELRVAANLSREPAWIEAFLNGVDIHLRNAQLAYGDPTIPRYIPDPVKPEELMENPKRGKGKTMTFAVLFGAEDETVAEHGGISVAEASELLKRFWSEAGTLDRWVKGTHAAARTEKVVRTFLGRERPLHGWYTEESLKPKGMMQWLARKGDRESVNTQIQGGAADIFKIALVRVDKLLTERDWHAHCHVILPMHDELVFRVRRRLRDAIIPALIETMGGIRIANWPVPFTVDCEIGPNWGKGLKKWDGAKTAVVADVTCETCGAVMHTDNSGFYCVTCRAVERHIGPIVDVRRVRLNDLPPVADPRNDRPRIHLNRITS